MNIGVIALNEPQALRYSEPVGSLLWRKPRTTPSLPLPIPPDVPLSLASRNGSARISDIAAPFPMSLTGFCKHVRILERARLVTWTRHGPEDTLALSARPLQRVAEWVLNYERFWNLRMDRLEKFFVAKKEEPR